MEKYKIHKDQNINSLIQIMAMRGGKKAKHLQQIRNEQLYQHNSILKANIMEKDEYVHEVLKSDQVNARDLSRDLS